MIATTRSAAIVRVVGFSAGAFVVYGGWAAWINAAHGSGAQLRAGIAQGVASAVSTAAITGIIEALRMRFHRVRHRDALAVATAASAASAWHVSVNLAAGTPAVLATVAPAVVMTWVFAAAYAIGLRRHAARKGRESRAMT